VKSSMSRKSSSLLSAACAGPTLCCPGLCRGGWILLVSVLALSPTFLSSSLGSVLTAAISGQHSVAMPVYTPKSRMGLRGCKSAAAKARQQ